MTGGQLFTDFFFMGEQKDKQLVTHLLQMFLRNTDPICRCQPDATLLDFDAQPGQKKSQPCVSGKYQKTLLCLKIRGVVRYLFAWV